MNHSNLTCMDDYDPDSLPLDVAIEHILDQVAALPGTDELDISSALGRITSEVVSTQIDVPSFTSSAMDGYAIRYSSTATGEMKNGAPRYKVIGTSLAGHPFDHPVAPGECVRITTGAALPEGTDTVVMQEYAHVENGDVMFNNLFEPQQFTRAPGTDTKRGDTLLAAGKRLTPADIGLLAAQGITRVRARKRPRVAIFSTGDELVQPGKSLKPGQIYDSNRPLLAAMIRQLDLDYFDAGAVGDDPVALRTAFNFAAKHANVIVSSGGVSVGEADFVRPVLEGLGELKFWKIAMKPGRPLTIGRYKNLPFFGLPGNPVSVSVTFTQLVRPALEKIAGLRPTMLATLMARTTTKLAKQAGRLEFQRGVLSKSDGDDWLVTSSGAQDSHALSSLSKANCYIVLPLESEGVHAGTMVQVQLLHNLI